MNIINVIISVCISTVWSILTICNFSSRKISKKSFITYFLIMTPLFIVINLYFDGLLKIITVMFATIISLYFSIFRKEIINCIYYSIVYELFVYVVEMILLVIFVSIFNFNIDSYNTFLLIVFTLLTSISIYLISKIRKLDNVIQKFNSKILKKRFMIIYIFLVLMLLTLLLFFNKINLKNDLTFYINVFMVIFIFVTLIIIIYRDIKNDNLENNYNEMMEYVQKYEKIINEQGKKNHEYNNQLMVIRGYLNNKKKLEEYLDLIINEHKCGQNYTIRELSYFPDGGIKGLIYHKLSKMEENNIKYYLYVDKKIKDIFEEKLDVKTYQDITKLLGVFLDNAIDATKDADLKEIELDIKKHDDCIIITITNTFNENIDTKQIGKKGFTTKGKGHGYGLSIVKDIAKHNDNIETFNDMEDLKFKQTIILYYKK